MRILVDADACPGKFIIEKLGKAYNIPVIFFCDLNHVLNSDYAEIKYMDSGFQSVDMAIANEASNGDIIVTQDFGVACMVLPKNCSAISPKGYIYDDNNIDKLLFERHLSQKMRKAGKKTTNPKKRNNEDDERLENNLKKLINKNIEL